MTNETNSHTPASRFLSLGVIVAAAALLWPQGASAQEASRVAEGGRLYGQTCGRCHNPRPSTERTDREWRTVMGHMRARANLSRSDARAIVAFLQATNGSSSQAPEGSTSEQGGPVGSEAGTVRSLLLALARPEDVSPFLRTVMPGLWWTVDAPPPEEPTPGAEQTREQ